MAADAAVMPGEADVLAKARVVAKAPVVAMTISGEVEGAVVAAGMVMAAMGTAEGMPIVGVVAATEMAKMPAAERMVPMTMMPMKGMMMDVMAVMPRPACFGAKPDQAGRCDNGRQYPHFQRH